MVNLDFSADVNTVNTILLAIRYANDFTIQHSGITRDGSIVTTKECVEYQIKKNDLVLSFDGMWEFTKFKEGCGWRQVGLMRIRYYPEVNKERLFECMRICDSIELSFVESKDKLMKCVVSFNATYNTEFDPETVWEEYINKD